jgi:hypothetical protein
MNGRCCVFQPFDKGAHDKRYEDTLIAAIIAAGLEPYRVDRDDGPVIPIKTLHDEIRTATICLADITTRNPNVMYELGYAIASGKDVLIISSEQAGRFPFDIQYKGIIQYVLDSASDLDQLKDDITNGIKSLLKKDAEIVSASAVRSTYELQPDEITALTLVMANVDSSTDRVSTNEIKADMENAGYNRLATKLALTQLARMQLVEAGEDSDDNGNPFISYRMLEAGENWLVANQEKLELRVAPKRSRERNNHLDDDLSF